MEIEVNVKNYDVKFEDAMELAKSLASNFGDAMMLSWCNYKEKKWYPVAECCGDKSWEVYACRRDGNLKVSFGEDFVFMFTVT